MCYTSEVVQQFKKVGMSEGDSIEVVIGTSLGFCKDVCTIRQGLAKGDKGLRVINSQFQEKCQVGENPDKVVVVTKGHMCIQGEFRRDNREGREDDVAEAQGNGMCWAGVGGRVVGEHKQEEDGCLQLL